MFNKVFKSIIIFVAFIIDKILTKYYFFKIETVASKIGKNLKVSSKSNVNINTIIGDNVTLNGIEVQGMGKVSIGDNCQIARECVLIAKKHQVKIKTFPIIGTVNYLYYRVIKKISWVPFLDYVAYNKEEAMVFLKEHYEFKPYPYKHYESVFTRFYQGYILPEKFSVDKRKMHLSSLICSDQMSRDEALSNLNKLAYSSQEALDEDIEYFLKKMSWKKNDLENYLKREEKSHLIHGTEKPLWDFCLRSYQKYVK